MEKPLTPLPRFNKELAIFSWGLMLSVAGLTYCETQPAWKELSYYLLTILAIVNVSIIIPGIRQKVSPWVWFIAAFSLELSLITSLYLNPDPPFWFWVWNLAPILTGSLAYGIGSGLFFLLLGLGNEASGALASVDSFSSWMELPWFNHCLIYLLFVLGGNYSSPDLEKKLLLAQQRLEAKEQECQRWETLNKELKRKEKENLNFQEQLTDEIRSRELLISLSQFFDPAWDSATILEKLLDMIRQTPGANAAGIYRAKTDPQPEMELTAATPLYRRELMTQISNLDIPALVCKTGKAVIIPEAEADPRLAKIIPDFKIKSALYVPFAVFNDAACLCLWSADKNRYSDKDYKLIEDIIAQAQLALKRGCSAEEALKCLNPIPEKLNTLLLLTADIKNPVLKHSLQEGLAAIWNQLKKIT